MPRAAGINQPPTAFGVNMASFGDERLPGRFWDKIAVNEETGCWEWKASRNRGGYGQFSFRALTKTQYAHRIAYLALVGEINKPQLDHLCRVRHCVNPDHLEPVTNAVNQQRGNTRQAAHAREMADRTLCYRGHPLANNTYTTKGGWIGCVTCLNERDNRRYARRWS